MGVLSSLREKLSPFILLLMAHLMLPPIDRIIMVCKGCCLAALSIDLAIQTLLGWLLDRPFLLHYSVTLATV